MDLLWVLTQNRTCLQHFTLLPWAAMKSWLTPEEYIGFLRGNIIKYQARAHYKDSFTENLAKAAHYQQELTEFMKRYTTKFEGENGYFNEDTFFPTEASAKRNTYKNKEGHL